VNLVDAGVVLDASTTTSWTTTTPARPPEDDQDPAAFTARKTRAYQAYYEHLPLADDVRPRGAGIDLSRWLSFGRLMELHVLDTRQFRTEQPCGDGVKPSIDRGWTQVRRGAHERGSVTHHLYARAGLGGHLR
jgi:phosphodiesterase/alkaline phosphatase D-like protein